MGTRRHPTETSTPAKDEHAVAVTGAEHEAAGVTAVMVSLQRGLEAMGAVRTAAALAVPTISEITNVLLMRGMIGKPGASLCAVRGHSNVQGDRRMGIWEKMPEKLLAALDSRFGIVSPREHGVDAIRAMRDGRANRSGVDQAEPQSRGPRRHCVDPAVTGPHRPRHPRWGETTGVGGRFDVHGSSVARQPAPAQRSGAQRGRHRQPAGPHPARPGYSTPVGNAAAYYLETNPLVPLDHTAARSNTPASKAIVIRLERT